MSSKDSKKIPKYLGGTPTEGRSFKEYVRGIMDKIMLFFLKLY